MALRRSDQGGRIMSASSTDHRPFVQGSPKDLREVDDRPRHPAISEDARRRALALTVKHCGDRSTDARMLGLIP